MATLQDYRDERLRKLDELKQLGVNPYPAKAQRTKSLADITSKFDELDGQIATVAGRITGIRKFGKLAFIVIRDASGSLQLFQLLNADRYLTSLGANNLACRLDKVASIQEV